MKVKKTLTLEQIAKTQELLARAMILNDKMEKKDQHCSFSFLGHIHGVEFRTSDDDYNTIVSEYAYLDWDNDEHNLEKIEKAIAKEEERINDTL